MKDPKIHTAIEAVHEVPDARPGLVVAGKYTVEEILGAGTFGLVARATVKGETRGVAIKLLRRRFNRDRETLTRFEREAKILAGLRSQRICRYVTSGTTKDGTQFIVTELLRGEPLRDSLERTGALPIDLAVRYLTQICEALGEAHSNGIVHRDLKPENIFVVGDNRDQIKLLDFGVARSLFDLRLTKSEQWLGSPLYMAPEQLLSPKNVGPAADIWALGVILQELVTGTTPFHGPTIAVVHSRILDGMRDAIEGPAAVLDPIIERCLQHRSEHRYASVTELVIALAPHAVAAPQQPRRPVPSATEPSTAATAPSGLAGWAVTAPMPPRDDVAPAPTPKPAPRRDTRSRKALFLAIGAALGTVILALVVYSLVSGPTAPTGHDASVQARVEPDAAIIAQTVLDPESLHTSDPLPDAGVITIDAAPPKRPRLPEELTDAQEAAGLAPVRIAAEACVATHASNIAGRAQLVASLEVAGAGATDSVRVNNICADTACFEARKSSAAALDELTECIKRALKPARFPPTTEGTYVEARFEVQGTAARPTPATTAHPGSGSGQATEPEPDFPPPTSGLLLISSKPPCEIYVDGATTGLHTPHKITLPVGTHRIRLINNQFGINESYGVTINPNAQTKLIKDYSDRLPPP